MAHEIADIAATIQQRIAEIDRRLAEIEALRQEREHLDRALREVSAVASRHGRSRRGPAAPRANGTSANGHGARRRRAPQGKNRERILAFLRGEGPSSASAIASATGIHRGVVYANLGKLADEGTVAKIDREGETTVFELVAR